MRGKLLTVLLLIIGACAYIAAPFYTAWSIREAAKTGKPYVLANSIYWPTVKVTLKESLAKIAIADTKLSTSAGVPITARHRGEGLLARTWKRIKASFSRGVINRMVDRYATPEGFATIFDYGRTYRKTIRGLKDPEDGLPLLEKIQAVWKRVRRAEFISWTKFEMDMVDKYEPGRMYCGVLELRGFKWMLTEIRVRQSNLSQQVATSAVKWLK